MVEYDPSEKEQINAAAEYCAKVDHYAHQQAAINLLKSIGVGLVAGLIYHALRPAPQPQRRLARLVGDMEKRLRGLGEPAMRKARALTSESAHAVGDSVHSGEAQVERLWRNANRLLRGYWS